MRLLFLVPSNAHKLTAGSRIRYDRLGAHWEFFDVSVESFEDLTKETLAACDICVLSKTYSIEALAICAQLREMGKIVGVDLFDDYFSQAEDSRLSKYRGWLQAAAGVIQFALCSTSVMRRLIESYAPDLPVHLLPDPYPEIDPDRLSEALAVKRERVRAEGVIDVLWFGIGSNPFFPVGLHDLVAFSSALHGLGSTGLTPRLTVLTNKAALTPPQLARLSKVPIEYSLEIWSLEAERDALEKAFVAYIPVNGQSFSRAKSLNRALTAISAGAQVLSPGFPLYRDLDPAIYSHGAELASDIGKGSCRIRPENVLEINRIASETSAVGSVVSDLFLFLAKQMRASERRVCRAGSHASGLAPSTGQRRAIVYGDAQDVKSAKAAKAAGVFSVKSPLARLERAYDIRLDYRGDRRLELWITPAMKELLAGEFSDRCSAPTKVGKVTMVNVDAGETLLLGKTPLFALNDSPAIVRETHAYRELLEEMAGICRRMFPEIRFALSEPGAHPANCAANLMADFL